MPSTYKGSTCKTPSCGGHRAGARYARSGGSTPSPHSSSFNSGMKIEKKRQINKKKKKGR